MKKSLLVFLSCLLFNYINAQNGPVKSEQKQQKVPGKILVATDAAPAAEDARVAKAPRIISKVPAPRAAAADEERAKRKQKPVMAEPLN